jgi:hypothetical protein
MAIQIEDRAIVLSSLRRRLALIMATVITVSGFGLLLSAAAAHASTVTQSGQVFASVGNSTVNVYDPVSTNLIETLNDGTGEPYTTGGVFDSHNNFYVTDDANGEISEYNSAGTLLPTFATGLSNPLSLVFDNSGNLYVGQQTTPYVAEFNAAGVRQPNIGPLASELYGVDWIALSSDECTLYYTSEGTDIESYNKCTNTQLPNFNLTPFTGNSAYQLQIRPNGDVLVADSDDVILLDPSGNVLQTYSCATLPGCAGQLFAVNLDPDGTSFWTGDSYSGDIWKINIATGNVLQTIDTHSGTLYGLTIDGQISVASAPTVVATAATSLSVNPTTGNFSTPTVVSAVLTAASTSTPIPAEPVTFTLNGAETCTGTTNSTGTASCTITPGEPASSYTLTASFAGDSTLSAPVASDSSSSTFVVTPDASSLSYTGSTTAVNGQPVTLSGTLTTANPTPGTNLAGKVVTFTIGSGSSAQSCSATSGSSGAAVCTISSVNQTAGSVPITATFSGDTFDAASSVSSTMTVSTATTLTVNPASGSYSVPTTVSAVLTNSSTTVGIAAEPVLFTVNGTQTCTATTSSTGTASCSITPSEAAGSYTVTASFAGDKTLSPMLVASNGSNTIVVTTEGTTLTYTGSATTVNGQAVSVSGVLASAAGSGIVGRVVTFTIGSGATTQSCSATTGTSGATSCTIASVSQNVGPVPVTAGFTGDSFYGASSASASVTVGAPPPTVLATTLVVSPGSGAYSVPSTVSAVLTTTTTGAAVAGEPVLFTLNGTQTCTASTNSSGVASCSITPSEAASSYTLAASFAGDTTRSPQLVATNSSNTFVVSPDASSLAYTGSTSAVNGQALSVSGLLTSAAGSDIAGRVVTFTLGSGTSAQSCSATSGTSGIATCAIASVSQTTGSVPVTASYAGDSYYHSASAATTVTVHTATTLTVSAATGSYAGATTVSATLTNAISAAGLAGEPVTFTLNGTQTCTGTTTTTGKASCAITPNEPAGTYTLTASFAGDTTKSPQLLASSGTNHVVVTLAASSIAYTGPSIAVTGQSLTLSAVLTTNGTALSGRTVTLTLGSGTSAQSCSATTTSTGTASCAIATVNQTAGSVPITASFPGDTYYLAASTSVCEPVASPPSAGAFVIGNVSAGNPTVGNSVDFWGTNWAKQNTFSGGSAPSGFSGYAQNGGGFACGATWTTSTKSSANPPSSVPSEMLVIVSNKITQSGTTISGTITHIVVVAVNSGYNSGMCQQTGVGLGKIVETVC